MRKLLTTAVFAVLSAGILTACTFDGQEPWETAGTGAVQSVEQSRGTDSSGLIAPQNDVPPATPTATSPAPQKHVQALSDARPSTSTKRVDVVKVDRKDQEPASQVVDQPQQQKPVEATPVEVAGPKNSSALPSSPDGLKPGDRWMDSAGTEHLVYVPEESVCESNGKTMTCSGGQYAPVPPRP